MDVGLEHDEPHACRLELFLTVVEIGWDIPKRYSHEETVDHVQNELVDETGGRGEGRGGERGANGMEETAQRKAGGGNHTS